VPVSVLAGIAAARVATVVTCLLVGRAIRDRRMGGALRAVRALGLPARALGLSAAQVGGFVCGLGPLIFRIARLGAAGPVSSWPTRDSALAATDVAGKGVVKWPAALDKLANNGARGKPASRAERI
jgi:hypothetical protein